MIDASGVMRAAVYYAAGDIRIESKPRPVPEGNDVLVRVGIAGICGSDAHEFVDGPHLIPTRQDGSAEPTIIGHEFVGTVVATGPLVQRLSIGAVVVSGSGISCGRCRNCLKGRTNLCSTYHTLGLQRDGGLAQFVSAPESVLFDASDSPLRSEALAMTQPMAIAVHALRRSGLSEGDDAVIVGIGGIGAFLCFAAAQLGARVLALDVSPERLSLATRLGATWARSVEADAIASVVMTGDIRPDVVFEVSGSAAGWDTAATLSSPGTVLVPVGIQKGPLPIDLGALSLREVSVVGTLAHVFASDIPEAVALLARRDSWTDIASEVMPLDALVDEGLQPLASGKANQIKMLIDPWSKQRRAADYSLASSRRPPASASS